MVYIILLSYILFAKVFVNSLIVGEYCNKLNLEKVRNQSIEIVIK